MDEARRFLRYIIPGMIFSLEVYLLVWLVAPTWTIALVKELKAEAGVGTVLAGVVCAGGFGYLLGLIHHSVFWRLRGDRGIDYRGMVTSLAQRMDFYSIPDKTILDQNTLARLSRLEAWTIVNVIWYTRREANKIKGIDPKFQYFGDLVNSMGAARIGALLAASILLLLLVLGSDVASELGRDTRSTLRAILALAVSGGLVWLYETSYRRTSRILELCSEQALHDVIAAETKAEGRPVTHVPVQLIRNAATEASLPQSAVLKKSEAP